MLMIILKSLIKISFRSYKRILLIALFLLIVMLFYLEATLLEVYSIILLILLSLISALKAKEVGENWRQLIVANFGYVWFSSSYLYILLIVFANTIMISFGIFYSIFADIQNSINYFSFLYNLFLITNTILLYYLALLFISEFMKYEMLLILQKVLILAGVFVFLQLKSYLMESGTIINFISYLFFFEAFFNYLFIFILIKLFVQRKTVYH